MKAQIITNHSRIYALPIIFFLICIQSCKKFLVIPAPNNKLVTTTVFNNNATATSAQLSIYIQMFNNSESYKMSSNMGDYADELTNYSTATNQLALYTNALVASSAPAATYADWSNYYNYIYQANAVINGLQTTVGCSPAVKQQLSGESYFVRAFCHFQMCNAYGDVPIALTTDYNVTSKLSRSPRTTVLQQVIADLRTAQNLLNNNYVDGSDTIATNVRVRPTKAAALALMARAYLYLGDYSGGNAQFYQKADSASTAVLNNMTYTLPALNTVFSTTSTEAIWQLQTPSTAGSDTPDGPAYTLLAAPLSGNNTSTCNTISSQLLNAFEAGDQRRNSWIGTVTVGANSYTFPFKYKNTTVKGTEYLTILRLAEQYLIRAEARVHEGNITGAIADLNAIRTRAGLSNYTGPQDANSVLVAILHERQVELFSEWGHRWFDLSRAFASNLSVNAVTVMSGPNGVCHTKGGSWNANNYQLFFPLPQVDLNADVNLTQNPGY